MFKRWLTMKLYPRCTDSCLVIFRLSLGKSHDAPKERKLIESIYSKNNSYLLVNRVYEDNKTITLAKAHGFHAVVPPKKIVNIPGSTINNLINNEILSNDISFF